MLENVRLAFESVLDTILPLRPRSARTKKLLLEKLPLTPTSHELLGGHMTTLMDYQRPEVRDLIQSLKYDGAGFASHLCASVLSEYFSEELSSARMYSQKRIVIMPVPLHATRQRERGFNQIGLVLDSLPLEYREGGVATLMPHALKRTRHTTPQTHLSRAARLRNLDGAFHVPNPALVQNTHVYIVDDVCTTGATLMHASTALRRAGAEVSMIALARA